MNFNAADALRAMRLADAAYLPWKDCEAVVKTLGFTKFKSFEINGTEAFVAANSEEVVYAFRGTDSVLDVIKDLKILKKTLGDKRKVHGGFMSSYTDISMQVHGQVYEWWVEGDIDRKVTGVGHSLGAAINVLFSSIMIPAMKPTVWLFGCPRVGNRHFAREYNFELGSETWRIVNNNDAVCRVPRLGYRHVGREVYIDWRGLVHHEPRWIFKLWNQLTGRAMSWWKNSDRLDGLTDHYTSAYITALEGIKK